MMAGIGFELRRVFLTHRAKDKIRGYSYALLIAAGPMLASVTLLLFMQLMMRAGNVPILQRELFSALITRSFMASMLLGSGPSIAITRFVSDRIYSRSQYGIRASLIGALGLNGLLSVPAGLLLFGSLALPLTVRLICLVLLTELSAMYILTSYVSAVHSYVAVGKAYAISGAIAIVFFGISLLAGLPVIDTALLALCAGYGLCLVRLSKVIRTTFTPDEAGVMIFWQWITGMPRLVLSSCFYTLALFSHNVINWLFGDNTLRLAGGLLFAPSYDIACFLAVLTVLPASVRFLVQIETGFYERYKIYTEALSGLGTMQEIQEKRHEMTSLLWRQLGSLFRSQAVISLVVALVGSRILMPLLRFDHRTAQLFPILCLGFYLTWMVFIITTMILYFDQQTQALKIMLILWLSTAGLTGLLIPAGFSFAGLGLLVGALLAVLYSLARLRHLLKEVDYLIYHVGG